MPQPSSIQGPSSTFSPYLMHQHQPGLQVYPSPLQAESLINKIRITIQAFFHFVATNIGMLVKLPPPSTIQDVSVIDQLPQSADTRSTTGHREVSAITVGARLPPVPSKLVENFKIGEFIDMSNYCQIDWGSPKATLMMTRPSHNLLNYNARQ